MAEKEKDIVDVMFDWILELFSWLCKIFVKICGWVIKVLFNGIKILIARISGKKGGEATSGTTAADNASTEEVPTMRSYGDLINDIASIGKNDPAGEDGSPKDRLMNFELTALVHNTLNYAQKAKVLKKGDEKLSEITADKKDRFSYYCNMVSMAYSLINQMTNNAVWDRPEKFKAAVDPENKDVELEPLGNYLIDIMNIVAAMYSPDGKSSFRKELLEGVELPTWTGEIK